MKIDLLTSGGIYLKTFDNEFECAMFFSKTPSYIRHVIKQNSRIKRRCIFYRIVKSKGENNE